MLNKYKIGIVLSGLARNFSDVPGQGVLVVPSVARLLVPEFSGVLRNLLLVGIG